MSFTKVEIYNLALSALLLAKQIDEIVRCHNELLQTVIPTDFYNILMSMEEMFQNPDKAVHIFEKNQQLYNKFGGGTKDLVNNEVLTQFFDLGQ